MEATNPYQSPAGELTTGTTQFNEAHLFSPAVRIGRVRYMARVMVAMLVSYLIFIPVVFIGAVASNDGSPALMAGLTGLLWLALIVISIIFGVQRLHDLNASGWLWLLMLVPIINIGVSLYLMFAPGTKGPNNYGNPPPPNRWYHWLGALVVPVLFAVLGVVAAIAIPAYQGYVEQSGQMQLEQ